MAVVFVSGLCFWNTAYTPWKIGALAWRDNPTVLLLYGYRFTLGVVGVCTMGIVFDAIRRLCGVGSFFVRTVSNWGGETLALYILQTFCVETVLRLVCERFWRQWAIAVPGSIVNLIGYLILDGVVEGLPPRAIRNHQLVLTHRQLVYADVVVLAERDHPSKIVGSTPGLGQNHPLAESLPSGVYAAHGKHATLV